jgi:hypothetical protein
MSENKSQHCPACNAKPGTLHQLGCDVEQCPRCGRQLLSCAHFLLGTVKAPPDQERLPWTGEWPGVQECREFGWWAKPNPAGSGYVACAPDDPEAQPDLNRLLKEGVWDRKRQRFVRREEPGGDASSATGGTKA